MLHLLLHCLFSPIVGEFQRHLQAGSMNYSLPFLVRVAMTSAVVLSRRISRYFCEKLKWPRTNTSICDIGKGEFEGVLKLLYATARWCSIKVRVASA